MTFFSVILLALAAGGVAWGGSFWIDRLYGRNLSILTFPDAIVPRSRWRKPLLFIGFLGCGLRLLQLASGLPLVLMLVFTAFLLWMTATDFEQYCLFDSMMLPFALAALVMLATYPDMLMSHLLAGLAGGLVFLVLGILSRVPWAGRHQAPGRPGPVDGPSEPGLLHSGRRHRPGRPGRPGAASCRPERTQSSLPTDPISCSPPWP